MTITYFHTIAVKLRAAVYLVLDAENIACQAGDCAEASDLHQLAVSVNHKLDRMIAKHEQAE